jgi:catechol 2,3-dioxygenase-like lactoylglutathione lyase family enzyme
MPVHGFNHLNIRTPDFEQTVNFLTQALGMTLSSVPGVASTAKAAWILDEGGTAIFHLASADIAYSKGEVLPYPPLRGSGAVHHVALTCTDVDAMRRRLRECRIEFRESSPEPAVRQIFVCDPSGIRFELNFREP